MEDMSTLPQRLVSPGGTGHLPRIGNWEYDVTDNSNIWFDTLFDILELPYDTKPDNTFALKFYREPYQGMLKKQLRRPINLERPGIWNLN